VARANRLGKIADSIRRRITRQTPERQMQPIRFEPALPQAGVVSRNFAEMISARPVTSRPARNS
jgi:hypothetical protein